MRHTILFYFLEIVGSVLYSVYCVVFQYASILPMQCSAI